MQELSYRVANYFASLGYKKGDRVGIFMTNCAEYAPIWLGLSRVNLFKYLFIKFIFTTSQEAFKVLKWKFAKFIEEVVKM